LAITFCNERQQSILVVGLGTLGWDDSECETEGIDVRKEDKITQMHE